MPDQIFLAIPFKTIDLTNRLDRMKELLGPEKLSSSGKNDSRLYKACSDLESIFINYLLKEMRATVQKSGFISGGKGEEIYTSMLDSHLAKELSSKGGIGLASMLREQLREQQGIADSGDIIEKKSKPK